MSETAADLRVLYRAALSFAEVSREVVLRKLASGFRKRLKPDATYVTDADLAAERALRLAIRRRFPDHGILGEELPPENPEAPFQWILDPIDGTLSLTHGIPFFGTIIGLHLRGRPLAGVIDHPALGLRYSAGAGLGAWRDRQRLRIRDLGPREDFGREVIAAGDRGAFRRCGAEPLWDALARRHPQFRGYADCLGHALAVQGSVGAMVDYGIKLWDIAATEVLVLEAGGKYVVSRRSRREGVTLYGVVFGKPAVVDRLLPLLLR